MPAPPTTETAYDGPPIPPAPLKAGEAALDDLAATEADERRFLQQVFAFIVGALVISALFAAYMDWYRASLASFLAAQVLCALMGGLFVSAGLISRKIEKMPASVAMATLVGYSAIQGALFGFAYGAAYSESLAPVYLAIGAVFAGMWFYARQSDLDLTSPRSFLIGSGLAIAVACATNVLIGVSLRAAVVICVVSVLMLALAGYHRDFLRDLPGSFENDPGLRKAAAVGALQIYLDLIVIVVIIIQMRWFYAFIDDQKREKRRKFEL